MDAQCYGQGGHRPLRRRRARVRQPRPDGRNRNPGQPLPSHAYQRRCVGEGRPLLSSTCRRRSARAAVVGGREDLGRAGRRSELGQQHYHPPPYGAYHHLWPGSPTRCSDAPPESRAHPYQASLGMDTDGHRAEESRCPSESQRQNRLRHRRETARHEIAARHALSPVPYLPRARMASGTATGLVTENRVDIWLGDQSPQETRRSAAQITGIPETNVYVHLCHLGGGYGRNGNGPQAEQAIYIANLNRGTPIHLLWTREEDFINTTYRSIGVARLRAALDKDCLPIAMEVRTATDENAPGATAGLDVAARYFAPNYRFSTHSRPFHIPVGTRRGVGAPAQHFYRESIMDELAHAAGKDPYLYRRELISRTNLPYKADMIMALDTAAQMSGWGTPLPKGTVRAIALEERGDEAGGHATISAQDHTASISKQGEVRLMRVDVAHDEGFG